MKLNQYLEKLLSRCQCLPKGDIKTPWTNGGKGEVPLVVNPAEYRLDVIQNGLGVTRTSKRVMRTMKDSMEAVLRASHDGMTWEEAKRISRGRRRRMRGSTEKSELSSESESEKEEDESEGSLNENEGVEEEDEDSEESERSDGQSSSDTSSSEDERPRKKARVERILESSEEDNNKKGNEEKTKERFVPRGRGRGKGRGRGRGRK